MVYDLLYENPEKSFIQNIISRLYFYTKRMGILWSYQDKRTL